MHQRDTQFFVDLESKVWAAQVSGDADADRELLSGDFVGVYPTGFAARDDHVEQLSNGPVIASFTISHARLIVVSAVSVMLSYRADYKRPGGSQSEAMFVSSLWGRDGGRWQNTFSQDTPVSS
ncbi:DUF4440 domain-containing protein [Microbacterium sp. NPDC056234]|uniref:DUF4440 domain-containing protein n=1 Tax=Microbacterium sp. NPDC056234 TaxID=3345757 RepID=UPI0035D6A95B